MNSHPFVPQPLPPHSQQGVYSWGRGLTVPPPPILLCDLEPTSASLSLPLLSELVIYGHLPRWPSC